MLLKCKLLKKTEKKYLVFQKEEKYCIKHRILTLFNTLKILQTSDI